LVISTRKKKEDNKDDEVGIEPKERVIVSDEIVIEDIKERPQFKDEANVEPGNYLEVTPEWIGMVFNQWVPYDIIWVHPQGDEPAPLEERPYYHFWWEFSFLEWGNRSRRG